MRDSGPTARKLARFFREQRALGVLPPFCAAAMFGRDRPLCMQKRRNSISGSVSANAAPEDDPGNAFGLRDVHSELNSTVSESASMLNFAVPSFLPVTSRWDTTAWVSNQVNGCLF
jgi:hypothetical protein